MTFPSMSFQEKRMRAQEKRSRILKFLSTGEVYTSLPLAARVMSCSISSAERTLHSLVRDGALKFEQHLVRSRKMKVYGISPHGQALAGQFESPCFEVGRTNPSYIFHHLQTQQARLQAESAGWAGWQPGKALYKQNLLKVPDALCISPVGKRVAIEIERHVKTRKRYEEIISAHLQAMSRKDWDEVHYLAASDLVIPLQKIFGRLETITVKGERVSLEDKHHARFKFFLLDDWPLSTGQEKNNATR